MTLNVANEPDPPAAVYEPRLWISKGWRARVIKNAELIRKTAPGAGGVAYVAPIVLTLAATPAFARNGSSEGQSNENEGHRNKGKKPKKR